jgi:hypothetical protein
MHLFTILLVMDDTGQKPEEAEVGHCDIDRIKAYACLGE